MARTVDIARQIARALAAAHQRGVIHRDLKPANVFLTVLRGRAEFVKLLDFGVAKLLDREGKRTAGGVILGTPGYMAPEQATGSAVDERVDVYALGVLIYRMLAGQLPFPGRNFGEMLQRLLTEVAAPLATHRSDVPPALAALVARLLSRDRAGRPGAMAEVEAALAAIAAQPLSHGVAWSPSRASQVNIPSVVPAAPVATPARDLAAVARRTAPSPQSPPGRQLALLLSAMLAGVLIGALTLWVIFRVAAAG